ncbi:hypothetical protein niasHS_006928 [Heterodera schachtii]|uniref:ARID domain-containing protein n=1 Tax=Heterodera schachtii TaxID=97005 RepID=A0ABD2JG77_HETSC
MEYEPNELPPVYLPVGTEVSAKFKGAFCEARITKLVKSVKIKVQLKDSNIIAVDESAIQNGRMEINQNVEVIYMKQIHKGQIICIKDCSSYTVIFNDGDERILKRTQLCQKGAKHFKDAETLDKLPLYHPDKRSKKKEEAEKNSSTFNSPNSQRSPRYFRSSSVTPLKGIASTRSATRAIAHLQFEEFDCERSASAAADCSSSGIISNLPTKSNSLSPRGAISDSENEELFHYDQQSTSTAAPADEELVTETAKVDDTNLNDHFPPGTAVIVNAFSPSKFAGRIQLGLVVSHEEFKTHCKSPIPVTQIEANHVSFRNFQNGRYVLTSLDRLRKFDTVEAQKLTDFGSMGLKVAFDRANNYLSRGELPQSWTRKDDSVDLVKKKKKKAAKVSDSSSSEDDDSKYNERRDLCVAHFYKFQDESGNQLNKVPLLGGKEIDIYRFYDVVSRMGGHKRVTQEARWRKVLRKLHLEETGVSPTIVKNTYIRYFEKFEAFMKNLGYSSLTISSSNLSTNSRTTRMIRGYNQIDQKSAPEQKKKKQKERRSLDRGLSISKESDIAIKSRSGSFSSSIVLSPAVATATKTNESQHNLVKQLPEAASFSVNAMNGDGGETDYNTESTELNVKEDISESSQYLFEKLEKKRTDSHELESRSTSAEGSPITNKKELNEPDKNSSLLKKPQGIRGRRPKIPRDQRTKSPSGHQAVLEDIGFTNAHIFTRFYQGQNVHARHHLRFYDARVIMVKQPTLQEIATSLCDAFDLSIISRQISQNLTDLSYENMGAELKRALHSIMMSTKIFVHYLGWNSRYDEWLMLHKIRVDEKDEKSSSKALEQLMPDQFPSELFSVAMDWCRSAGGIASLAALPGAQSSEQRPRRLSSATLSKTNGNSRKNNEMTPLADCEPDKQPTQQQYSSQILSTNTAPLEIGFRSPVPSCVYSAHQLPPKTISQQLTKASSFELGIPSSSSSSSPPHTFISVASERVIIDHQTSSLNVASMPIKNDSTDCNSLMTMGPCSIVVKTSQSTEYAKKSHNILTSSKQMGENKSAGTQGTSASFELTSDGRPSPKEVSVEVQAHLTKFASSADCRFDCKTTVFVNAPREYCKRSIKVFSNYERKIVVFQQQQQLEKVNHGEVDSLNLPGNVKTAQLKEETKSIVHNQLQQPQNTTTKKRIAPTAPMSPPSKLLKQTNKKSVGRGGGKTSTDATTETSEDDECFEGTHSVSMHSMRQRVLQKMEDEHLFDSYSFVGLSELDDELEKCADDPDEQVRLIESRMRELSEIFHKYKGKLADLEKEHKKRSRQEKKRKMMTDK